ncbi:MAG: hypothetical protein ACTSR8_10055 [Promethearchaeota archaeon]
MNFNKDTLYESTTLKYSEFIKKIYSLKLNTGIFNEGNFSITRYKDFGDLVAIDDVFITFDSWNPQADIIFISHAHFDHIPVIPRPYIDHLNKKSSYPFFICSRITKEVAEFRSKDRFKFPEDKWFLGKSSNLCQSAIFKGVKFTLLENGHTYGSTSLLIEGSEKILYTGDFITEDRIFSEGKTALLGLKPIRCDRLIMECTYGLPNYVFPSFKDIQNDLITYIQNELNSHGNLILLGYAYGKSQIILNMLNESYSILLHKDIVRITEILEQNGIGFTGWGELESYRRKYLETLDNCILLVPPYAINTKVFLGMISSGAKVVALSGKVQDPSCRTSYSADYFIPLSDHCDFPRLLEFIIGCNAEFIYLRHGKIEEFNYYLCKNYQFLKTHYL